LIPEFSEVIVRTMAQESALFGTRKQMSDAQKLPLELAALPDWAVLTDQQTTQLLGFSLDTLGRLDRAGDGPPRVELSPRRHGRPVGELRKWVHQRLSRALSNITP
jgi:predicted DNA-binding transcriptional regulator AlpA